MLSFDTIVAPATPPGEGGVGIIRLSGPGSIACLGEVFQGKTPPTHMTSHQLYYGHLHNDAGTHVDEVLAVIMRAPRSYTGEDVVEVHCHGGTQVMRNALDLILEKGARMARPGEFTQRAFMNGRLDLAQAEAVVEIIKARSERASKVALDQLEGHLSQAIYRFSDVLRDALALLEAHIDFPDDEVGALDLPALLRPVTAVAEEIRLLADSFDLGRALREGVNILILGRPNVGKSSLMNAMLGERRAIVTEVAGTTRDTLEEQLVLAGFPVRLIDAAGVRDTDDLIEQEGVKRARDKALAADLVLMVVDGSVPLADEDMLALELCRPEKTLIVVNKSDLAQSYDPCSLSGFEREVPVSAKHGLGMDGLKEAIVDCLASDLSLSGDEGVVINERRHKDALLQAVAALARLQSSAGLAVPLECLAMELREALSSLGLITGETTPDELLEQIFSRFCIGK
jgi:tRNA modification GTPase